MKKLLNTHKWGIAAAILIAIIIALPQLLAPFLVQGYSGLSPMEADSEMHYWTRVLSARDQGTVGNPFLKDANTDFIPTTFSAESVLAFPMYVLGGSVELWNLVYRLILGMLLGLSAYYFLLKLHLQKSIAAIGSICIILGSSVLIWLSALPALFSGNSLGFLHFSRFAQPIFSGVFFFLFLGWIADLLSRKRVPLYVSILVGVAVGSMAYMYIFYWLFLGLLLGLLGVISVLRKSWAHTRAIMVSGVVALVIDLPYIMDVYSSGVLNEETGRRVAAFATTDTQIGVLLVLMTVALGTIHFLLRKPGVVALHAKSPIPVWQVSLFEAMVVGSWIILNHQILTGKALQPGHFYWYVVAPLTIVLLLVVWTQIKHWKMWGAMTGLAVIIVVGISGTIQFAAMWSYLPQLEERQHLSGVVEWMRNNTHRYDVIFADQEIANIVPVELPRPVVYANAVVTYPVSQARVDVGHFLWWWREGLSVEDVSERVAARPEFIQSVYEPHNFRSKIKNDPLFLSRETDRVLSEYELFLSRDPVQILRLYNVSYVLVTHQAPWITMPDDLVTEVYTDEYATVYQLVSVEK